jgi:hypothetical protein
VGGVSGLMREHIMLAHDPKSHHQNMSLLPLPPSRFLCLFRVQYERPSIPTVEIPSLGDGRCLPS